MIYVLARNNRKDATTDERISVKNTKKILPYRSFKVTDVAQRCFQNWGYILFISVCFFFFFRARVYSCFYFVQEEKRK